MLKNLSFKSFFECEMCGLEKASCVFLSEMLSATCGKQPNFSPEMGLKIRHIFVFWIVTAVAIGLGGLSGETYAEPGDGEQHLSESLSTSDSGRWEYGKFRLRIGVQRPVFDDKTGFYEQVYGEPANYMNFGVDYSFLRKYLAIGLGLKLGYYVDRGFAVKGSTDAMESDENGALELTLVPLTMTINAQFSPFPVRYLGLDTWAGVEVMRYQEVRDIPETENKTSEASAPITNKGVRKSAVLGVALNILLNGLDPATVRSMRSTMGLGAVYFSPYLEVVTDLAGDSKVQFNRKTIGISFTFESAR